MRQRFCNGMIHVIKQGENLYQLSRKYRVPLALILRANPYVDVYNLQPGQEICIPMSRPIMPFPGIRPPKPRNYTDEDRVEQDEDMRVDRMQETMMEEMDSDDNRELDEIRMEQQEEKSNVYVTNGVMSLGDVLQEVGMTVDELLANNDLHEIILAADVKLIVPKKV